MSAFVVVVLIAAAAGCAAGVVAEHVRRRPPVTPFDPVHSPGMTDLMVPPETIP